MEETIPDGMKKCRGCKEVKERLKGFNKNRRNKDGFQRLCKSCQATYNAEYYLRNTLVVKANSGKRYANNKEVILGRQKLNRCLPEVKRQNKNRWLRRRYNLTIAEYDELVKVQNGRCLICHEKCDRLYVDHDHSTGEVRGLLCDRCNKGLGCFKDSPELLSNAIIYLSIGATNAHTQRITDQSGSSTEGSLPADGGGTQDGAAGLCSDGAAQGNILHLDQAHDQAMAVVQQAAV